jgi:hypothetical protein
MQDGLLRGQPNVITQTKDGYIWIGTAAGLMRFDGVRLIPWEPPAGSQLPSHNVRALLAARDGSLWIGTDAGLSHWTQQNLVTYLKEPGIVSSILEDHLGTIWVTRAFLKPLEVLSVRSPAQNHSAITFLTKARSAPVARLWWRTLQETSGWGPVLDCCAGVMDHRVCIPTNI